MVYPLRDMADEKILSRTEISVLPADQDRPKLGFTIREYLGSPVYKRYSSPDIRINTENTLKDREDVQEGDKLAIPWLTGGYVLMTVKRGEDGELYAQGSHHMAALGFDEDDRHCWTCCGLANLRGVERLALTT